MSSLLEKYKIPSFLGEKARTNEHDSACNHTHLWLLKAIYDASIAYIVEWRCKAGWEMKDSKISRRDYIVEFENSAMKENMTIQIGIWKDFFSIKHWNGSERSYANFTDENEFVEWLHEY